MKTLVNTSPSSLPTLSGYTLLKPLYVGRKTSVYRGIQNSSQRGVVVKMLCQEYPSFSELVHFLNQYKITKDLAILGVVHPIALEPYGRGYALVMEDCGSISLQQYIQQQTLSVEMGLAIAQQLCQILHHLHQQGIIHKDIKPANLLIHPHTHQIKLIDFSIASQLPKEGQDIQNPNQLEGTLSYIAPEQTGRMNRGIDYRTDFYSLGVTLYQLFTRQLPFNCQNPLELVHCHLAQSPPSPQEINPTIPDPLCAIILKLMAKNAEDRYQTVLGLEYDLTYCLEQWRNSRKIQPFELGQRDSCDRFLIPEKLYGRETAVETLLNAFERVVHPLEEKKAVEMMLVAGFSGIGKTALIQEVYKPITRQKGYFIQGKFDQFQRNIPLFAFVQALQDLIRQLLAESEVEREQWKAEILGAVGENGQILLDVIPELEQIIGPQPPLVELSGSAAQYRFNLVFQEFIAIFTTPDHPLVIFLDDLQWADSASLALLKLLMEGKGDLLLLGAYRDNEVSPSHPFRLLIKSLKKAEKTVNQINLTPLNASTTHQLVAETLHCFMRRSQGLSDFIYHKTKGNPFFITQLLKALYSEEKIWFNEQQRIWEWDLKQIQGQTFSHDVVNFMAQQIQKLPVMSQQILKFAACIGNEFDLATLAIVVEQTPAQVAQQLWDALQEGLILPQNEGYKVYGDLDELTTSNEYLESLTYRFLHDRIQQAAYSLIPENKKHSTHYKMGKILLKNLSKQAQHDSIFEIVNHLNFGQFLPLEQEERNQIAQLNLFAGQKAMLSTAYATAIQYFQRGLDYLDSINLQQNSWVEQYQLKLDLFYYLAAAQLSNSQLDKVEKTIKTCINFIISPVDRAKFHVLRIVSFTLQGRCEKAIKSGLLGLEDLGITIDQNNLKQEIEQEFLGINSFLNDRTVESILHLPAATNPQVISAIQLLIALEPTIYIIGNLELYTLVSIKAVHLSIINGNTQESVKAYANYGLLLGLRDKQYQRGYEFGELAVQLSDKLETKSQECKACLLLGSWIHPWAKPIAGAAEINYKGFLAGMDSGEIQFAAYNLMGNIYNRLFAGEKLSQIDQDIEQYWQIAEQLKNELLWVVLAGAKVFISQVSQSVKEQKEDVFLAQAEARIKEGESSESWLAIALYYLLKMQGACISGNFKQGLEYSQAAKKNINAVVGFTTFSSYYYYGSLILLNCYPELSAPEQTEALKTIEQNQEQLKIWSEHCPENFLHKYLLVQGEQYRLQGNKAQAIDCYDQAIAEAEQNGFVQEAALAQELATQFYLSWGKPKIAATYLENAYYSYGRWDAKGKIQQLESQYSHLLPLNPTPLEITPSSTLSSSVVHNITTAQENPQNLWFDLPAVMQASQGISQEIELEKLLGSLMQLAIANAGAQRGCLILREEGEWSVRVQATCHDSELLNTPLSQYPKLPHRLIETVIGNREAVVFDNLSQTLSWGSDRYVRLERPQSVLCAPILGQGKLMGILYLENNLTRGAFTRDRLQILQFLTSQAAISLENARLYEKIQNYSHTLEAEVAQKTQALQHKAQDLEKTLHQLQQTQAQLIQSEKMSSLGQLVAGIAHEINNPISFIKGNITHLEQYLNDLLELVSLYQEQYPHPGPMIEDHQDKIELDFLVEDSPRILQSLKVGSERIRQIVLNLRNFSRLDEAAIKTVDLHSGLESTLLILQNRLQASPTEPEIQVVKEYGVLPAVTCYPSQLNQVFLHILTNAIDAMREHSAPDAVSQICLRTAQTSPQEVKIAIANTGTYIPPKLQQRIFDPFFTTKPVGHGTGLGLFVSYSIIQQHGGSLSVSSSPEQGTEFVISLPLNFFGEN
ncbi:AAA family ATPase [Spirulina subsalsa FACHB-351]|uniref:histidine kinase n=1 Tax=Spirulina subsalsa FACHB-351 TaxID=234711 RepID=A0ABT3L521_9CYAN|nr:ATP-binding sensor histidine kinase [Spirulina subsalsa]MCW6036085.1 AAA family ATPase [Spirulina subsalsa FACHB-351]